MHSLAWLAWLVAAVAALSATRNPLYLLLAVACLALVGAALPDEPSRLPRPFAAWKFGVLLIGLAAGFNALTSHYGETRLFTIPGRLPLVSGNVTLEALVYGATNGLALAGLLGAFWVLGQALPVRALVGLIPPCLLPAGGGGDYRRNLPAGDAEAVPADPRGAGGARACAARVCATGSRCSCRCWWADWSAPCSFPRR